jgi:O-antigen/teichoic acid export membrane protein
VPQIAPGALQIDHTGTGPKWLSSLMLKGVLWTVGAFTLGQSVRLFTNVVLARLLAPELFGIMLLVRSLCMGFELLSDLGIGQNIITDESGDEEAFYCTAWTLQVARGFALWIACCLASIPLGHLYQSRLLVAVLPVAGFYFVITGFTSVSPFLAQRRQQLSRLNAFEFAMDLVSSISHILFALLTPTVWALLFGGLFANAVRAFSSHRLLSDTRIHFMFSTAFAQRIFEFAKWIFLSTLIYYFATSFDRLYLAKAIPLGLLGIYGLARTFADLVTALVQRMSLYVVFPLTASLRDLSRPDFRAGVAPLRLRFLSLAAIGLACFIALPDLLIGLLYDHRYQAAGWMISMLAVGAWVSILCSINESMLLGLRLPLYAALANGCKLAWLVAGLPAGLALFGVPGAIMVVAASDLARYMPIMFGQVRHGLAFGLQDIAASLLLAASVSILEWIRLSFHLGTSFDGLFGVLSQH